MGRVIEYKDKAIDVKKHLDALKVMRTNTNVQLSVMFPGEGIFLRFINTLIIAEQDRKIGQIVLALN